jgi:hypothetical protein
VGGPAQHAPAAAARAAAAGAPAHGDFCAHAPRRVPVYAFAATQASAASASPVSLDYTAVQK